MNSPIVNHELNFEKFFKTEKNIPSLVYSRVEKYGNKTALKDKYYGKWEATSWKSFGEQSRSIAKALLEWNVKIQEMVGIFSQNRANWTIADIGILSIRAVSIPIYSTNSQEETEYIINDAEIKVLFVNDQKQYDKSVNILKNSKYLKKIIVFDKNVKLSGNNESIYFTDFLEIGRNSSKDKELDELLKKADADDLYTLIYTSGTTGTPKGVMLTHKNILAAVYATGYPMPVNENHVSFCFLPLSHVFERSWTYFIFTRGAENHYCHNTKEVLDFFKEVKPHFMVSVPRVWEKIYGTINEGLKSAPEKKQKLFAWALKVGEEYYPRKNRGETIPQRIKFKHAIAKKLVLHKIQDLVGGRTNFFHVGGAPFSGEINEFFVNAGVRIGLGYGMTEIFPICVGTPEDICFGTSGKPIPLMNVKVNDDGEILAKSLTMMQGYWKKEKATKETITKDGWIMTGDIGEITSEGYIKITDRKKELIITAGGKNISPLLIETYLKNDIFIEQAVVIGEQKKYISALIVPNFGILEQYAKEHSISFSSRKELTKNPEIIKMYTKRIESSTKKLGQVEKIKKFVLLADEFKQENGELTPTSKIKRKNINNRYKNEIESMY